MPEHETFSVTLPSEIASRVKDAVEAGDYASPSEVVRAALNEWTRSRSAPARELASLRADIAEGLADVEAGHVEDFDADRIIAHGRKLSADRSHSV